MVLYFLLGIIGSYFFSIIISLILFESYHLSANKYFLCFELFCSSLFITFGAILAPCLFPLVIDTSNGIPFEFTIAVILRPLLFL